MNCNKVKYGAYECVYNIMTPFRCGFQDNFKYVSIDKCLIHEVINLWENGIRTTGCCCGHGDKSKAFIGVKFADIPKMKSLGYCVAKNPCRPNDEDSFVPKTQLKYGSIK